MLKTFQAKIENGNILLNKNIKIPDKSVIFISYIDNSKDDFFLVSSESSLEKIWNNEEDDVYENLLEK
jgi:hypothetical protein